MPHDLNQEISWLIEESKRDYIDLWHIMIAVNEASDVDPKVSRMQRTLDLVGKLLDRGFQAVDLLDNGRCKAWSDQGRMSILRRIEREWRALNDEPLLGTMFWFHLPTSKNSSNSD